jgi:RNA polymerase sigma-70 factor (sigma-E family)
MRLNTMDLDLTAERVPGRRDEAGAHWVGTTAADAGRSGRAAAVSALYADHALGLIRLAHIMLGSRPAAEDVVHEAFLGLYRRWAQLDDQSRALGYLRSSVLNGCRSVLRRRPTFELDSWQQPPATSAESAVLSAEEQRELVRALRSLPPRQREVLALKYYLELPDEEIADAMGIRQGTVRSARYRGLAALGRAMRGT